MFLVLYLPVPQFLLAYTKPSTFKNAFVASGCESKVCYEKGVRSFAYGALFRADLVHRSQDEEPQTMAPRGDHTRAHAVAVAVTDEPEPVGLISYAHCDPGRHGAADRRQAGLDKIGRVD